MVMSDNNLVYDPITKEDFFYENRGEWKIRSTYDVVKILHERTVLRYIRSYPKEDRVFIYNRGEGVYREFTISELMVIISKIFQQSGIRVPSMHALEDITKHLKFHINSSTGNPPIRDEDYLVFTNGMLNISTGVFGEWDPEIFTTILLPYAFDPNAQAPRFLKFLKEFTSDHPDREEFLRAWFWAVLKSWVSGQIFLYLLGPGGTGKYTLVITLMGLIGRENTMTTGFRELSPAANLQGKKLIVISDNDNYNGSKQMIGQDSGRQKLQRLRYNSEGMVVIVGNSPLSSRDKMDDIGRRIRQFPADNVCREEDSEDLLTYTPKGWMGPLANEFPGIFAWAHQMKSQRAQDLLRYTTKLVPSIDEESRETMNNPMLAWVREELEGGKGSYVGFKMNDVRGNLKLARGRNYLYPAYRVWAENRDILPLGHKRFTNELSLALQSVGLKNNKIRKLKGMYIEGIVVKSNVSNRDKLALDLGNPGK